jgi:signal transduction histidine kinase
MFTKLSHRMTVIFVGLAVIPLIIVTAIFAIRTYNDLIADSVNDQVISTRRFEIAISDKILEITRELRLMEEVYGFGQLTTEQQNALLGNLLATHDDYEQIAVLNANGFEHLRVSRLEVFTNADLADRSADELYQSVVATGDVQFSPVYFDERSGEPLMTIAIPFLDLRSGKIGYILMADFRFRVIWDLVTDLQSKDQGTSVVFVTDASGLVLAHTNPTIVLRGTKFALPAKNGRAPGLDGEDSIVTTRELLEGGIKLVIVGQEHMAEVLKPIWRTLVDIGLVTLATLAAVAVLVTLFVRQVVSPIEKLSKVAQSIQKGNLDARAAVLGRDEIGILAQSFNDMASRVQDSIQTLEDRVAERVRDVTLASEVSRQITTELDSTRLLADVADLTATAFNLYHVSIFLYDDTDQGIRLHQGTGKIGQQMVAEGKHFHITDQGLVPQAARNQEATLSNDVLQDPNHVTNPLLPDTRAELAVPMLYRMQLVGVLDIQSREVNRFRSEDVGIMVTLAEQIAIAVRNAQLFEQVHLALAEAERANSVKSHFLASMSHELRTPLNAIINFTKFLLKEKMGPINERQADALEKVKTSGVHLLNLINDVLDVSKIESGSLHLLVEEDVDLGVIIEKAETTARALLEDKPVTLHLEVDPELPHIVGDRQRILQILLNIISNACKFTEEGSITIRAHSENEEILISVQDTGPGISAKEQAAVFETFQQTEAGLRKGSGTGLGMPISRRLAEAHGGDLLLESEQGKGATFTVVLPVHSDKIEPNFA